MKQRSIGIGLMGLGVVGGQVAKVLLDKAGVLAERAGCPLELRKIKVTKSSLAKSQKSRIPPQLFTTDTDEFFAESDIDIVIEAIGGENMAQDYIRRAISSGKYVITGNGLKDTDIALKNAPPFLELPADLPTVEQALGWS